MKTTIRLGLAGLMGVIVGVALFGIGARGPTQAEALTSSNAQTPSCAAAAAPFAAGAGGMKGVFICVGNLDGGHTQQTVVGTIDTGGGGNGSGFVDIINSDGSLRKSVSLP